MASKPIRIGIVGAGRMGLAIIKEIGRDPGLELASIWVRDPVTASDLATPSGTVISADLDHVMESADVIIDFSLPEATAQVAGAAAKRGKALVCGVSGAWTQR